MPIRYRIDPEQRLIHVQLYGILSVEDVLQYRAELQRDPGYSDQFDRLIDARAVSKDVSRADVRRLADLTRLDDQGTGRSRRAVILRDLPTLALMEVFQAYVRGNPAEYRVFQHVDDAERWLRTPHSEVEGVPSAPVSSPSSSTRTREVDMTGEKQQPRKRTKSEGEEVSGPTHGDSAVGRENPADGAADADEALGNRVGGYGSRPIDPNSPRGRD